MCSRQQRTSYGIDPIEYDSSITVYIAGRIVVYFVYRVIQERSASLDAQAVRRRQLVRGENCFKQIRRRTWRTDGLLRCEEPRRINFEELVRPVVARVTEQPRREFNYATHV